MVWNEKTGALLLLPEKVYSGERNGRRKTTSFTMHTLKILNKFHYFTTKPI